VVCRGTNSQLDQASCHASRHYNKLGTCLQLEAQSVTANTH